MRQAHRGCYAPPDGVSGQGWAESRPEGWRQLHSGGAFLSVFICRLGWRLTHRGGHTSWRHLHLSKLNNFSPKPQEPASHGCGILSQAQSTFSEGSSYWFASRLCGLTDHGLQRWSGQPVTWCLVSVQTLFHEVEVASLYLCLLPF